MRDTPLYNIGNIKIFIEYINKLKFPENLSSILLRYHA